MLSRTRRLSAIALTAALLSVGALGCGSEGDGTTEGDPLATEPEALMSE